MHTGIKNSGLVVLSLAIGFLLLEVGLRAFVTVPHPAPMDPRAAVMDVRGFWIFDPGATFTQDNRTDFRGKAVSIDANGMRRVPCREPVPQVGAIRIFTIGDSQTFGYGLSDEESWPNRLQCRLNRMGRRAKIFNLGVPAINTDQYLMRLSQIWPQLRPGDQIIVALTWNDLVTDLAATNPEKFQIRTCPAGMARPVAPEFQACLVQPKLFLNPTVTWRLKLYRETGLYFPSFESVKAFAHTMQYASALAYVVVPKLKYLWYAVRNDASLFDKLPKNSFSHNMRIVARLRDLAAEKGAQTQVVLLPNRIFTDDYYYRAYSKGGRVFTERDFPKHATAAPCSRFGLDCFSLFDALRTSQRDRFTYVHDGHLNPAGAKAVANALSKKLERHFSAAARMPR